MYINWELFGRHLFWIFIALIPQIFIFLKILFFKIIRNIARRNCCDCSTEREKKIILWAKYLYYDSDENDHVPLHDKLDNDDYHCFKWYKVLYMKELLNKQYHTNYKITPGYCNVTTFPTAEILSKLNRAVRI